jgi:translation initiation factor RLI1
MGTVLKGMGQSTFLMMLVAVSLLLPFRTAHASESAAIVIAGGPKFRRPQLKKPETSGSTTPQGAASQGKGTSGQPYSNQTLPQLEKSKKSYEELIREHERKLADYRKDPFSQDNKGLLKDQPPEIQKKIIEGRVRELETQLEKQRSELKKIDEALRALPTGN